jgi:hypothetical protein
VHTHARANKARKEWRAKRDGRGGGREARFNTIQQQQQQHISGRNTIQYRGERTKRIGRGGREVAQLKGRAQLAYTVRRLGGGGVGV